MKLSEAKLATQTGSLDWFMTTFFDKVDEEDYDEGITYTLVPKDEFTVREGDGGVELGDLSVTKYKQGSGISIYMTDKRGGELGGMDFDPREVLTVDVVKRVWPK